MSLLHADFPSGSDGVYANQGALMLNGTYATVSGALVEDPSSTETGWIYKILNGNTNGYEDILRWVLPATTTVIGCGFRVWFDRLPSNPGFPVLFAAKDLNNDGLFNVGVTTTGAIRVYNGNFSTILGTSNPVMVTGAHQHVEIKGLISATVGTVEVRVEGEVVLALTGLNTARLGIAACAQMAWGIFNSGGNTSPPFYIKDVVLWNNAGTLNNNFLGSVQVYDAGITGDVSFNWAASSGATGYNLIDEVPPNDDVDYIYAVHPSPPASSFTIGNLPADVTSVKGVVTVHRTRKVDGGDGNIQVGMISSGDTALGADRPMTTTYTYWRDVFETDPHTGVAWTPTTFNAAELQIDRTL